MTDALERLEEMARWLERETPSGVMLADSVAKEHASDLRAVIASVREGDWNYDLDAAPKPKWNEPMAPVLLTWSNLDRATSTESRHVGEAYWRADEDGGGDWWWANTSSGDYYADAIRESITGHIIAWSHLRRAARARGDG